MSAPACPAPRTVREQQQPGRGAAPCRMRAVMPPGQLARVAVLPVGSSPAQRLSDLADRSAEKAADEYSNYPAR